MSSRVMQYLFLYLRFLVDQHLVPLPKARTAGEANTLPDGFGVAGVGEGTGAEGAGFETGAGLGTTASGVFCLAGAFDFTGAEPS